VRAQPAAQRMNQVAQQHLQADHVARAALDLELVENRALQPTRTGARRGEEGRAGFSFEQGWSGSAKDGPRAEGDPGVPFCACSDHIHGHALQAASQQEADERVSLQCARQRTVLSVANSCRASSSWVTIVRTTSVDRDRIALFPCSCRSFSWAAMSRVRGTRVTLQWRPSLNTPKPSEICGLRFLTEKNSELLALENRLEAHCAARSLASRTPRRLPWYFELIRAKRVVGVPRRIFCTKNAATRRGEHAWLFQGPNVSPRVCPQHGRESNDKTPVGREVLPPSRRFAAGIRGFLAGDPSPLSIP
jgi:hypothetical protein